VRSSASTLPAKAASTSRGSLMWINEC